MMIKPTSIHTLTSALVAAHHRLGQAELKLKAFDHGAKDASVRWDGPVDFRNPQQARMFSIPLPPSAIDAIGQSLQDAVDRARGEVAKAELDLRLKLKGDEA